MSTRIGLALSELIRFSGLVIALHEEFLGTGDRSSGFAVAGVMMSSSLFFDALLKRDRNHTEKGDDD